VENETVEAREAHIREEHQVDPDTHLCSCGWTTATRRFVSEHEAHIQRLVFGLLR
jgi:hypothetical protein